LLTAILRQRSIGCGGRLLVKSTRVKSTRVANDIARQMGERGEEFSGVG
jgi:hypothetical protein